jgi:hypothetical protein
MVKDCDVADVIVDGLARAAAAGINAAPDIAICIRVALEQRGLEIRNIPRR